MNKCDFCDDELTKEYHIIGDKIVCDFCYDKLQEYKRDGDIIEAHKAGEMEFSNLEDERKYNKNN